MAIFDMSSIARTRERRKREGLNAGRWKFRDRRARCRRDFYHEFARSLVVLAFHQYLASFKSGSRRQLCGERRRERRKRGIFRGKLWVLGSQRSARVKRAQPAVFGCSLSETMPREQQNEARLMNRHGLKDSK